MRLDIEHVLGRHAAIAVDLAQQGFLGVLVRHRQAHRMTVGIDAGGQDDAVDDVAIALGGGERFQHDHAAALSAHIAVAGGVEAVAAAGGRQHGGLGEADPGMGMGQDVDGAGQCDVAGTLDQAAAGLVHADQAGGTGRVDGHGGAVQVQHIGNAVGGDGERAADVGVGVGCTRAGEVGIVLAGNANKDAGARAGQMFGHECRILQRFPGKFQGQAVLRIDLAGLTRGHAEEGGVESIDLVQEAAGARVDAAGLVGVGVMVAGIPTAFRHLADGIGAAAQDVPEARGRGGAAGVASAEADNGNGRGNHGRPLFGVARQ